MNEYFSFEDLKVYKEARKLVKDIYLIQGILPQTETFGLGNQIRRAAISITANLAEGSGRTSIKEKIHFIEISFGSLMEAFCELQTASDLGYIDNEKVEKLRPQFRTVSKLLSGLRNHFLTRTTSTH